MPMQMPSHEKEELLELLWDLRHDLGKYLIIPLRFLPTDAGPSEVRMALQRALFATQKGPNGVYSAKMLWERFLREAPEGIRELASYDDLVMAVRRALAWESALAASVGDLDRMAIEADLGAVGGAIGALISALDEH